MRKSILFVLKLFLCNALQAQLMAGASFGTFVYPGAFYTTIGLGPTIKIEYANSDRTSAYLDASLYAKEHEAGTTTITEPNGNYIGEADTRVKYSIRHLQLGFKGLLGNDITEEGLAFFLGGGVALSSVKTIYKYTLPGYTISDSKYNSTIFGFHFNAGVQYNLNPVIIELKGNFDLMLKPVVSGESYIMFTSRIGVLIPLSKAD